MRKAMPLFSKPAPSKTRKARDLALPLLVAELGDCDLHAHCDRCGRALRLHPGPIHLAPRARLASLLDQLHCGARRNGAACGGRPRRLILTRDERRWVLEAAGGWVEDDTVFWEQSDFEAMRA
jgi:hypothetical protein